MLCISKKAYELHKIFYADDLLGYVHNSVDISHIPFKERPKKEHDIELSFVSSIDPFKGPDIAIAISEGLHNKGYDVRLRMTGKVDRKNEKYFRKLVEKIADKPYIELSPNMPTQNVYELMGNSDALLFPISWEEPFGVVILESFACGTPVISFIKGAVPEIIENGFNGYLCKDSQEMQSAINSISQINRRNCRNTVTNKFDNKSMYENYMVYYKKILFRA